VRSRTFFRAMRRTRVRKGGALLPSVVRMLLTTFLEEVARSNNSPS